MKKLTLLVLLGAGLATSASAAFTAGIETGYLLDNKDAYWAGQVGWEFRASDTLTHQVALEYGWTDHSETVSALGPVNGKIKLRLTTINYRAETTYAEKFGFYFGAGAGSAHATVSFAGSGVPSVSDSGNAFGWQVFAGANYQASPTVTLHAGAKYINVGNMDLFAGDVDVGDDVALTLGVSVRF